MNAVQLIGRLGKDPESRTTSAGQNVCTFSIAVDNGKGKDADWFDIVAWGDLAGTCAQYLAKGRQVAVTGRLQTRSYEAKDGGSKRKVVEIVAGRVDFLGGREQKQDDDVPF